MESEKHSSKLIQGLLSKSSPADRQKARTKMIIAANIDEAIQKKAGPAVNWLMNLVWAAPW